MILAGESHRAGHLQDLDLPGLGEPRLGLLLVWHRRLDHRGGGQLVASTALRESAHSLESSF